ncbi:Molybdenum cofactor sulfurase [Linum perenne]
MQSPCLNEYLESCLLHGCCPAPIPLNSITTKTTSRTTTTMATNRRNFATSATSSSTFPTTSFTNPDCLPSLHHSFMEFTKSYPQYSNTCEVDEIRARDYHNLSQSTHTCLDYIGIGLFSCSQIQQSMDDSGQFVASDVPFFTVCYKSGNLKTQLLHGGQESELESAMRKRVMKFMNISGKDYSMVFTANRTSAFKLLAESYPFKSSKKVLSVYDYESEAVEAMNKISVRKGGKVMSAEFSWPRLRINSVKLKKMIVRKKKKKMKRGVFVFPLHSRMTGARYPYSWMRTAQENEWHLLIDACALGPKDMDSFALALIRPDFIVSSFYKIFGENPSGFGCLFVKKSTIPLLEDYTGAGMVSLLPGKIDAEVEDFMSRLELGDGEDLDTSNSFSGPIAAKSGRLDDAPAAKKKEARSSIVQGENHKKQMLKVECRGLDQVDSLGLSEITNRGRCLINWLVNALMKLKHPNSQEISLVRIYGPKVKFDRGPALAFNVFDWKGEKIEPLMVQKLADRNSISLSYGFLHHISFSDKYEADKAAVLETKGSTGTKKEKRNLGITVVTIALGFLSSFEDAYRLWAFIAQFLDADFVEKANWRYTGLNQKTVEV